MSAQAVGMGRPTGLLKLGALAAVATGIAIAPAFLSTYVLSLVTLAFIAALLASSVNLLAGALGVMSIGHAGVAAAAGYGIAWGTTHHLGLAEQLALALLITAGASAAFGITTMRSSGIVFLMITLALGVTVYGLTLKMTSVTGGQNGMTGIDRPAVISSPVAFFGLTAVVLAATLLAVHIIWRSPFGLAMRGVRESSSRMASLGYSVPATRFVAVLLSGLLAGTSGVLAVWHNEFMSPASGDFSRSAFAVVMVIVGGTGFLLGPVVGAAVVVGIQQWASSYFDRWPTLLGLVFIAVVVFAPTGIVGALYAIGRRLRPDHERATQVRSPGRMGSPAAIPPTGTIERSDRLAESEEET